MYDTQEPESSGASGGMVPVNRPVDDTQNAVKSSAATSVKVALSIDETAYHIYIADQGSGFDVSLLNLQDLQHRGLALMQARLERIGGTASIVSQVGTGTTVHLMKPIGDAKAM